MNKLEKPRFTVKTGMLAWNPCSDQVEVVPWPDYMRRAFKYEMTCLACNSSTQDLDESGCKAIAFIEAMHLIVRDSVCPKAVHNAMLDVKEYRECCAQDMLRKF